MQFGHDRTFIGNGYRSLIFSDYSPPSLFLRTNVKVWKLNYLFQLNRVTADAFGSPGGSSSSSKYPQKFMAFHQASFNIGKKFNVGVFESVVFSAEDSVSGGGFDIGYLNPVIFYRAIEQQFGSSDNVIVGLDFKWNAVKRLSFYGQLVIDEFLLDRVKEGNGWWANKYGFQIGFKTYDLFRVKNLYFQTEYNEVRPYTYAHSSSIKNYGHYNAAIAHPIGGNFKESVTFLKYHYKRLYFSYQFQYAQIGEDIDTLNYGRNIYLSYNTRVSDYNNYTGQGLKTTVIYNDITASYLINPSYNLNLAIGYTYRSSTNDLETINTSYFHIGLRTSIGRHYYDF